MTLLLPIFFAFTGLHTSVRLIASPALARDTAIVIAVAVIGKGGASALAARATGLSWRTAGALGALLNTRGLIELVILNIGLDAGILSPVAFSILVVMALVTTFMTSPLLHLLGPGDGSIAAGAGGEKLERLPVDLAARVDRKAIDEDESPRNLVRRQRLGAPLADGERRQRRIRAHEERDDLLSALIARHAEHARVGDAWQLQQPALDLGGVDLAARHVDERRDAPGQDEPASVVQIAEVAGEESAVGERRDVDRSVPCA